MHTTVNDTFLLKQELERQLKALPYEDSAIAPKLKAPPRKQSVREREVTERINIENCRLANAIIAKKSEFSKEIMQKEWWQKVLPVQKFMKMSRRPFKVEVVPLQERKEMRTQVSASRLHGSRMPQQTHNDDLHTYL